MPLSFPSISDEEGYKDSDLDAQEFLNRQHVINDMVD